MKILNRNSKNSVKAPYEIPIFNFKLNLEVRQKHICFVDLRAWFLSNGLPEYPRCVLMNLRGCPEISMQALFIDTAVGASESPGIDFKGDWTIHQRRGSTEPNSLRYDPSKLALHFGGHGFAQIILHGNFIGIHVGISRITFSGHNFPPPPVGGVAFRLTQF